MLDAGPYYFPCCLTVLCTCIGVTRPCLPLSGTHIISAAPCSSISVLRCYSSCRGYDTCTSACLLRPLVMSCSAVHLQQSLKVTLLFSMPAARLRGVV